jgi:hypothetical protein
MPYEDPIEAALRALTDVEWRKRPHGFEARINKTHLVGIQQMLEDHQIEVRGEISAARSGRYIATVPLSEIARIERAVQKEKLVVKPMRRKAGG